MNQEKKRRKFNLYIVLAFSCIILGIAIVGFLFFNQPKCIAPKLSDKTSSDVVADYFTLNGTIGDFVGRITGTLFSLAGFFLIYLSFQTQNDTLLSQNEALENQKEIFEKQNIESRFFELIKLHRANIEELVFRDWRDGKEISTGRNVFKDVYNQLNKAIIFATKILTILSVKDILKPNSFIDTYTSDDAVKKEMVISNLAYSLVFFGVAEESYEGLKNALQKDFEDSFVLSYISFFQLIPTAKSDFRKTWDDLYKGRTFENRIRCHFDNSKPLTMKIFEKVMRNLQSDNPNDEHKFYKLFGGHQSKLGHYYRHLFRTVSYIDSKTIKYEDKEEYVRVLRAQLSNYEQFLLFFNSICFIGREWELKYKTDEYKKLISKFNLIRNIPYTVYKYQVDSIEYSISLASFYPLVAYEFEDCPSERIVYIKRIEAIDEKKITKLALLK